MDTQDRNREEAMAVFSHAAEEIRFFKGQQWSATNYALTAYAALALAPHWVEGATWWKASVSLGCFAFVWAAFCWAWSILESLAEARKKERRRMDKARLKLPLVAAMHNREPRRRAAQRRFSMRPVSRWFHQRTQDDPIVVLRAALVLGAMLASMINLSRIPWAAWFNARPDPWLGPGPS